MGSEVELEAPDPIFGFHLRCIANRVNTMYPWKDALLEEQIRSLRARWFINLHQFVPCLFIFGSHVACLLSFKLAWKDTEKLLRALPFSSACVWYTVGVLNLQSP